MITAARLIPLGLLFFLGVAARPVSGQAGGGIDDGSWIALNPPRPAGLTARLLDIDCPDNFACYAVGEGGAVLRTSGGDRWQRLAGPSTQVLDAIDCPTVAVCLVVAGRDVYYGFDFGRTRGRLPAGSTARLRDIDCPALEDCVVVGDAGTILWTHDHGQTWAAASPVTSQDLRGVSCPSTRTCFASGGDQLILASSDGGASWRVVLDSPTPPGSRYTSAFGRLSCPSESTCVVVASSTTGSLTSHGAVRTTNAGATWSYTIIRQEQTTAPRSPGGSIDCVGPDLCLAALPTSASSMMISLDGGESWGPLFETTPLPSLEAVSCPDENACYAVGANGTLAYSFMSFLGDSWMLDPLPMGDLGAVVCPSPQDCYAVGDGGSLHDSHDGGATWRTQVAPGAAHLPTGITDDTVTFSGIDCTAPLLCFAVGTDVETGTIGSAVVYGTGDGGESWLQLHHSAGALRTSDCPSKTTCLAIGSDGHGRLIVVATSDAGGTWNRQNTAVRIDPIDIDCPSEDTCYAVGGGVAVTRDGGATWQALDLGQPGPSAVHSYAITCPSIDRCLLLARTTGLQVRLLSTEDGGAAWTERTPPVWAWVRDAGGIHCFSELDCVLLGDRTLSTTDGGLTWRVAAESGPAAFGTVSGVSCAAPGACMAVTTGGLILAWNHPPSVDFNGALPGTDTAAPFAYAAGGPPVPIFDMGVVADPDPWQRLDSVVVAVVNPQRDGYHERLTIDSALLRGLGSGIRNVNHNRGSALVLSGIASVADYQRVLSSLRYEYDTANPDTVERVIAITAHDGALAGNSATTTVVIRGASTAEPALTGFTPTVHADGRVTLAWETTAEPKVVGYYLRRARWAGAHVIRINEDAPIPAAGSTTTGARYAFDDRPGVGRFRYWLEASDALGLRQVVAAVDVWVGVGRVYLPRVR